MKKGFTLVELLTVIAIIAILAALIFPVANTVREAARRSRCSSNLQQIYVALEQYKLDEGAYPRALFGYLLSPPGETCSALQQNQIPPMDQVQSGFLMPYLKSVDIFKCPNNIVDDRRLIAMPGAYYPYGHALYGAGPTGMARLGDLSDPTGGNSPHLCFYRYDSYDIGYNPVAGYYEVRYTLFWTNYDLNQYENSLYGTHYGGGYYDNLQNPGGNPQDNPRQLGYRNPDKTAVVTWCTYHRTYQGTQPIRAKNDLVLFLSGNVRTMDSTLVVGYPYNIRP